MASEQLVSMAKMARRMTTDAFDDEVSRLLDSAMLDLGLAGVEIPETLDPLVGTAAITYFLMHFGRPDDYERLKASYDEQKAQLMTASKYTDWRR